MRSLERLLQLEVPVIVRLAEKTMTMEAVTALLPGMIIELPKGSEEMLDLLVNNKVVGVGRAVKVGENFGLRVEAIGDESVRLAAMGNAEERSEAENEDEDLDAMAAALLAGQ